MRPDAGVHPWRRVRARYSRTSETVIRVPLMQDFPLRALKVSRRSQCTGRFFQRRTVAIDGCV